MTCYLKCGNIMDAIIGGVAEWLHENGIKTSLDTAYKNSRLDAGLLDLEIKSFISPVLGIYSNDDKLVRICWVRGDTLILQHVTATYQTGDMEPYLMVGVGTRILFELADPGFLDDLLSKVAL